jgi:hypothetical protein
MTFFNLLEDDEKLILFINWVMGKAEEGGF